MGIYSPKIQEKMIWHYQSLSEKERRRYAAIEALKLGHGGIQYIATLFGCSRSTIYVGIKEIENGSSTPPDRIRKEGGGRKTIYETIPTIEEKILEILEDNTAGSPVKNLKWTNLTPQEIKQILALEIRRHNYFKYYSS